MKNPFKILVMLTALTPLLLAAGPAMASKSLPYNSQIKIAKGPRAISLYGCRIESLVLQGEDPVTREIRNIKLSFYKAKNARANPAAIILLPPTGGVNILDRGYANELCSQGFHVALVHGWDHQGDKDLDIEMHNRGALRALVATRHVVEFLKQERANAIGLIGTSIGAITGLLATSVDPAIQSAALIVGSGRFADVVAESSEQGAAALRKERMQKWKLKSAGDYRRIVKQRIHVEPLNYLAGTAKKSFMLVTADQDITVPTVYQNELVATLKPQVHLALQGNHVEVIKSTFFWHRHQIVDFFKATLN